jgi:halimadienyl-diphosphate synthase
MRRWGGKTLPIAPWPLRIRRRRTMVPDPQSRENPLKTAGFCPPCSGTSVAAVLHVTLHDELLELARRPGPVTLAPVAHDTAWVARVGEPENPAVQAFPGALQWLLDHQHGDGTWGGRLAHHQDRVVSTLAAMVALAQWREVIGNAEACTERLHAAGWGLAPHLAALGRDLTPLADFEARAAALVRDVRWRRLIVPANGLDALARRSGTRAVEADPLAVSPNLDADGSLSGSAARTARYLLANPTSPPARAHLTALTAPHGGAAPPALPGADLFQRAWVLRQAALTWPDRGSDELWAEARGGLRARLGVASDRGAAAVAASLLFWAGEAPPRAVLRSLADGSEPTADRPFLTFVLVGAQVHTLAALRAAPAFDGREAAIRKIIGFLARTASTDHFWIDGRHASPYYATAHAVLALGPGLSLTDEAVGWMEQTQRPDGSWGFFERSTVEESAYCVQALACHRRAGGQVAADAIERGARFIEDARPPAGQDYEPLWVAETLYAPTHVVHATVLSALILARG